MNTVWSRFMALVAMMWREVAKFGVVGAVAWVIDTGVFLWLIHGPMDDAEVWAKGWAAVVAAVFSWAANRWWTFRHRRQKRWFRELILFGIMNAIGMLIAAGCVAVTKYVLGMTSPMALFIAGSLVGLVLGTIFRYFAYRFWVFNHHFDAEPGYERDYDILSRKPGDGNTAGTTKADPRSTGVRGTHPHGTNPRRGD